MVLTGGSRSSRNAFRSVGAWLFLGASVLVSRPARADDSPFAWLSTAEVTSKGEVEVEQWLTLASDRFQERYDALAGRSELEYGAFERLSLSLYANYDWTRVVPHGALAPDAATDGIRFSSVSGEVIYQIFNPSKDPLGLALYAEPSIGAGERKIELKLLLQKNLLGDRLVLPANSKLGYMWPRDRTAGACDAHTAFHCL